ncbi:REDY-like protein HapK [Novosphingobium sp. B 225]|uniref:REDY-like protein HapK n=1 Tax=Novosphingobium sp. B 225 TaxID=1961849 RepID=UPI000B4A5F7C|nr:REDY-like protein HapK [Novosphingobium sp. B 225]
MATIILKYRLKHGVSRDEFETWVKTTDHPVMRGLSSVAAFDTYRVTGLLMGEGAPSVEYVELFDIADLAAFTGTDMPGDTVQGIMGQFMGFADAPEFLLADKL